MTERNTPNGPFVIQANTHNAEVLRQLVQSLVSIQGIVNPTDMAVTATGTPDMNIHVFSGLAFIKGTEASRQGQYHVYNDASVTKAIAASDPTNARHDLIVAKVQDADFSGATNTWSLFVVQGTPSGSPVDPTVPNNAVVLAMVNVRAATASILTTDITDRRPRAQGMNNDPLGRIASVLNTAGAGSIGTGLAGMGGMTVTLTPPAGRRYKISAQALFGSGTLATTVSLVILDGATQLQQTNINLAAGGQNGTATAFVEVTPTNASHTYSLSMNFTVNANNSWAAAATYPTILLIEDIGAA